MSGVIGVDGKIFLSYSYLEGKGISYHVVKKWASRKDTKPFKHNNEAYIDFSIIPTPSKSKLPSEAELLAMLSSDKKDSQVSSIVEKLKYAQTNKFSDHRAYYRDQCGLDSEAAFKAAMKRAVWERLMELYNESHSASYNGGLKKGALDVLYTAYNTVYSGQYSSKHALLRTINQCKSAGFDSIIIDKRKSSTGNNLKFNELHAFFVGGVVSIGKGYNAPHVLQLIIPMCNEAEIAIPSLSWVKNYIAKNLKHNEYNTRYGRAKANKLMPYASIESALNADSQWQIDGWNLPFYFKNEDGGLDKLTLISVVDAYSRKIIGYSISRTENRISIMEAFQDAISNTGCVPFEILADNHSFNKTKEAQNFINELERIGTTWTISENPQYKSIIERSFKVVGERYCKTRYGYVGQGIKSKDKNAHSSPEMLNTFQKSGKILQEAEIKMTGVDVVLEYNKTINDTFKKSPNQLYAESEKPARFELDLIERIKLTTLKTEYKISRGQINIVIAGVKHEYQVDTNTHKDYNGKKVAVRYNSPDIIYLFDVKTDKSICAVKQKSKIHGALADQTENDKLLLAKNTGRTKGITSQSRKHTENIAEKALKHHPDAFEILQHHTTPKDVLKAVQTNTELRREMFKNNIDLDRVTTVPKTTEITNSSYLNKPQSRKDKSPFTPANHKVSIVPQYVDNE